MTVFVFFTCKCRNCSVASLQNIRRRMLLLLSELEGCQLEYLQKWSFNAALIFFSESIQVR